MSQFEPTTMSVQRTRQEWSGGWFEMATAEPHAMLTPWVRGAYVGWTEVAAQPMRRVETAATIVPLVINFGAPYRLDTGITSDVRRAEAGESRHSFVAGLYDTWVTVESAPISCAMQVNLTPFGARVLFGIDLSALTLRSVEFVDLLGAHGARLIEQLANAADWSERFARFDHFLCDRLLRAGASRRELIPAPMRAAWQHIDACDGDLRIASLNALTGWSAKKLIAAFREYTGLPPKSIARIMRFERVVEQMGQRDRRPWTERALANGYYDQSHLIRDFAQFAGCSPTQFLKQRLPDGGGVLHAAS